MIAAETFNRYERIKGKRPLKTRNRNGQKELTVLPIASKYKSDIVFFDQSPDACKKTCDQGTVGTKGRSCDPTTTGQPGSCDQLCTSCNREILQKVEYFTEDCNCTFEWCCQIKCEKCARNRTISYCK